MEIAVLQLSLIFFVINLFIFIKEIQQTPINPVSVILVPHIIVFNISPVVFAYTYQFRDFHIHIWNMYPWVIKAMVISNVAFYILYAGYKLSDEGSLKIIARFFDPEPKKRFRITLKGYIWILIVLGVIGIILIFRNLDFLTLYLQYIAYRTRIIAGAGYYIWLANLMVVAVYLIIIRYWKKGQKANLWVLLFPIISSSVFLILSATRLRLILLFATIYVASQLYYKKKLLSLKTFVIFTLTVVLILSIGILREADYSDLANFYEMNKKLINEKLTNATRRIFTVEFGHVDTQISIFERFPKWYDYELGKTYLAILTMPIPRKIYPDKPTGAGPVIANAIKPGKWSLKSKAPVSYTPTMIGEMYMNFGLAVTFFLMFFVGWFYRKVYNSFLRFQNEPYSIFLYSIFLLYFTMNGYLNEFVGFMMYFWIITLPMLFAKKFQVVTDEKSS